MVVVTLLDASEPESEGPETQLEPEPPSPPELKRPRGHSEQNGRPDRETPPMVPGLDPLTFPFPLEEEEEDDEEEVEEEGE